MMKHPQQQRQQDISLEAGSSLMTTPLINAMAGQTVKIFSLPRGVMRAQFIRLGIHEGQSVQCIERLPGGTVVIQKHRQQTTIGFQLAKEILVIVIHTGDEAS